MFGKNKATENGSEQQAGAVRQSRFAKELNLSIGTLDFGLSGAPQDPYSIQDPQPLPQSEPTNFEQPSFEAVPETPAFETPAFDAPIQEQPLPGLDENADINNWSDNITADQPAHNYEEQGAIGSLDTPPVNDQLAASHFVPPETDFYAPEPPAIEPSQSNEPANFEQQFDNTTSWDTPTEGFQQATYEEVSYQDPTVVDSGINMTEEIPPVELNPSHDTGFSGGFSDDFNQPAEPINMQAVPESSGEFLDNLSENVYPSPEFDSPTPTTEFSDNTMTTDFGNFSDNAITEAENAFEEAGDFLFPDAQPESLAPDTEALSASNIPPTDITSDFQSEISDPVTDIAEPSVGFESSFSESPAPLSEAETSLSASLEGDTPVDPLNSSFADPLSSSAGDPINTGSMPDIATQPLNFDPMSGEPITAVPLDPSLSEAPSTVSLNPEETAPTEEPMGGLDPENLQVIATHPLIEDKSLMLVEGNGQVALMGQVGYDENAMVAIIKMFTNNPIASNQTFTAVKEASAGSKHMFLTQVGDWQGIISCDERIVALHTELS